MVYKRRRRQRRGSRAVKAAKIGVPWALMALNSLKNSLHAPKSQHGGIFKGVNRQRGGKKQKGWDLLRLLIGKRKLGKIEVL